MPMMLRSPAWSRVNDQNVCDALEYAAASPAIPTPGGREETEVSQVVKSQSMYWNSSEDALRDRA